MNSNNTIKPCPFCGGNATVISKLMKGKVYMWVSCANCGAGSAIASYPETAVPKRLTDSQKEMFEKPLLDMWNRRIADE